MMNTKSLHRNSLSHGLAIALITGAALAGGIARADTPPDAPRVGVRYSKADIADPKALRVLYARLQNAARQVCPGWDSRDLSRAAPARACYAAALSDAVGQVRQPALLALHSKATAHSI